MRTLLLGSWHVVLSMSHSRTAWAQVAVTWICVIQCGLLCGIESVVLSVFNGSPQFDHTYGYPTPGLFGVMTALYPLCAAIGALSTILTTRKVSPRLVICVGTFIWLLGYLIGALLLRIHYVLLSRALKGLSVGLITSYLPLYVEEAARLQPRLNAAKLLTVFQSVAPFGLLFTSLVSFFLHHYSNILSFNICWIVAASPAIPIVLLQFFSVKTTSVPQEKTKGDRQPIDMRIMAKVCTVQIGLQLTGVNVILYYMGSLCTMIGFSYRTSIFLSMGLYACNFLATAVSVFFVDTLPLLSSLRYSSIGMAFCHGTIFSLLFFVKRLAEYQSVLSIAAIAFCFLFMIIFSCFFNGISFVYTSEIANGENRKTYIGTAIGLGWFISAVLCLLMPIAMSKIGEMSFMIFNWLCSILYVSL